LASIVREDLRDEKLDRPFCHGPSAVDFEDGFTVFVMLIGFITALALMYAAFGQLYAAVSGMLPGYH
jgi:hypothetical protein